MKAVVLRSFGGSEQLLLENVPDPEPAFDEIALKDT
jgi:NADPH:quinone reductase-like Zn-dependent oxidoreductase